MTDNETVYYALRDVLDDAGLSFDQTIDRIREIVGEPEKSAPADTERRRARSLNAIGRLRDVVKLLEEMEEEAVALESPDPISELEARGARLVHFGGNKLVLVLGDEKNPDVEVIGYDPSVSDLRAAAARLLARVKGMDDSDLDSHRLNKGRAE